MKFNVIKMLPIKILMVASSLSVSVQGQNRTDAERYNDCWPVPVGCPEPEYYQWDCMSEYLRCNTSKPYHCTRQIDNKTKFIDGCAKSKDCFTGEAPYLVYEKDGKPTDDLHVRCGWCHDNEHYNDASITSSSTYTQCKLKAPCAKYNGIECNPKDSYDIYKHNRQCRCNARNNYSFSKRDLLKMNGEICTSDKSFSIKCEDVGRCPGGMERLLNYTCAPKCVNGDRTNDSDTCVPVQTLSTPYQVDIDLIPNTTRNQVTKSTSPIPSTTVKRLPPPSEATTQALLTQIVNSSDGNTLAIGVLIGVIIGLLLLVIIVVVYTIRRKKRKKKRRGQITNATDIEEQGSTLLQSQADGASDMEDEGSVMIRTTSLQSQAEEASDMEDEGSTMVKTTSLQSPADGGRRIRNSSVTDTTNHYTPDIERKKTYNKPASPQPGASISATAQPTTVINHTHTHTHIYGDNIKIKHAKTVSMQGSQGVNKSRETGQDFDEKGKSISTPETTSVQDKGTQSTSFLRNDLDLAPLASEDDETIAVQIRHDLNPDQLNVLSAIVLRELNSKLIEGMEPKPIIDLLFEKDVISLTNKKDLKGLIHSDSNRQILEHVSNRQYEVYLIFKTILGEKHQELLRTVEKKEKDVAKRIKENPEKYTEHDVAEDSDLGQEQGEKRDNDSDAPSGNKSFPAMTKEPINKEEVDPLVNISHDQPGSGNDGNSVIYRRESTSAAINSHEQST